MTIHQTGRTSSSTSEAQNCRVRAHNRLRLYWRLTFVDYFTKLLEDDLKAVVKPQYVDQIPKAVRSADKTVRTLIGSRSQMENLENVLDVLGWLIKSRDTNVHTKMHYRTEPYHGPRHQFAIRWRTSEVCHRDSLCSASRRVSFLMVTCFI
jgi:hypothetical protein